MDLEFDNIFPILLGGMVLLFAYGSILHSLRLI